MTSDNMAAKLAEKHNSEIKGVGHNSAGEDIRGYLKRLVALETEKRTISEDIRELKTEMKSADVDPAAVAALAKLELEDEEKRAKREALQEKIDSYMASLGLAF